MKILLQNSLFYPNLAGGTERSTYLLACELSQRGHQVDVLTTTGKRDRLPDRLVSRTLPEISGRIWEGPASGLYDLIPDPEAPAPSLLKKTAHHALNIHSPAWLRAAKQVLVQSDPDIVHTNNLVGMTAAVWKAAGERQKPILHTIRDFHLLCPRTTLLRSNGTLCERPCWACRVLSYFKLRASRHVAVVTSPSRYSLDQHLAGGGFPGARSTVIPNACETLPESVPQRGGRTKVQGLYLGALAPHKGIPELISALRNLFQDPTYHKLHFVLAGEGAEKAAVEALCREHPDRCRYLGVIAGETKTTVLNESDFVIAPSVWPEIFGRVILDGFSHGLPVIGSNRGGIPEVIRDGQDGQIIEPKPEPITTAIATYVQDDEIRLQHGRAASDRALDFSLAKQVARFEDIYRDL